MADRNLPVSKGNVRHDNRLALLDQAFFDGHRAADQREVMQVGWVYDHAVDVDALNRFADNLGRGLLGRLIERSPLPFGRHRWVSDQRRPQIDTAAQVRPRSELSDWFDECAQLPLDPESGPGWRLNVLPLADGSTAISLVLSHYVIDGIGGAIAVTEAAWNMPRDLGYPPQLQHSRLRTLIRDTTSAVREMPAVARAVVSAAKGVRSRVDDAARTHASRAVVAGPRDDANVRVTIPTARVRIDLDEWNARAEALNGTAGTLAAALTAKLDERIGREHGGGDHVTVLLTVNDRTENDVRAVAVSFARANIDPRKVTTDLQETRTAVKLALTTLRDDDDMSARLAPLAPFTTKRAWRWMIESAVTDPEHPAVCSNLGDTGPAAIRPDGTLCADVFARGASQNSTRRQLEQAGGLLHLFYGTSMEINRVGINICAYRSGSVTTKAELRELVAETLAEFDLSGEVD